MEKNLVKKLLVENKEFLQLAEPISRDYKIEKNANYVFVGPRRAGKTWFMYSQIHALVKDDISWDEILYVNFEDERLLELRTEDFDLFIESFKELYGQQPICFFDEIQNIEGWEKFVRRLADQGYNIYVTGSNASMLSRDIATTLGGRFLIKEIHPLSFSEFLRFNNVSLEKNYQFSDQRIEVRQHFDNYFYFGGFPETLHFDNKREYLSNLFQKVFYGDIIERYKIKNDFALKLMIKKMAESVHDETSFSRIRNIVQSTGTKIGTGTLIEYFSYLEDSFLMFSLQNAAAKITSRESKKKYYFNDNGVLNLFLVNPETILLENLVFTELRRRYGAEYYYIRNTSEVDFYIPARKELIQVCYSLDDVETQQREINALERAAAKFSITEKHILTLDREEQLDDVTITPIWKWLLSEEHI